MDVACAVISRATRHERRCQGCLAWRCSRCDDRTVDLDWRNTLRTRQNAPAHLFGTLFWLAAGLLSLAVVGAQWSVLRPAAAALALPGGLLCVVCALVLVKDRFAILEHIASREDEISLWRLAARPPLATGVAVALLASGAVAIALAVAALA